MERKSYTRSEPELVRCVVCGDVMDIQDAVGPKYDDGVEMWYCPECVEEPDDMGEELQ